MRHGAKITYSEGLSHATLRFQPMNQARSDLQSIPVLPSRSVPNARRTIPHLRLTAAILVAMLAALAGGLDSENSEQRARRAQLNSALRLVSIAPAAVDHAHVTIALNTRQTFTRLDGVSNDHAPDAATSRASRLTRRAAGTSRAFTLQTSALPPPAPSQQI